VGAVTAVIVLILVSLGAGILARRLRSFPPQTAAVVNALVIDLTLPALVLQALHTLPLTSTMMGGAVMLWLLFAGALAMSLLLRRTGTVDRAGAACLTLTAGLGNTAFVGYAVVEAAFGKGALGVAVFVDQLGTFLAMATVGLAVAAFASGSRLSLREVLLRIARFPPFVALVLALLLRPVPYPAWLSAMLDRFGSMVTPLALFSVGYQLELAGIGRRWKPLVAGLGYKLLLAPAAIAVLFALFAPVHGLTWKITVLEAAMPPMVTGGIIAAQHELDPPLAAAMVGVGLVVSAASLAALLAWLA
jgi:predicted permease